MNIHENVTELIGNTPMVKLKKLNTSQAEVVIKLEYFNPANSIKDRAAFFMYKEAQDRGDIDKDTIIIEPTSGNTGIGLAMLCAVTGNKIILTMPESMSLERRKLLEAYGAELVLTEGSKGMQGAVDKANELHKLYPNSYIPNQFSNPSNPRAHYCATANEIWADTDGGIDIFVAGVGTGGTVSGTGKRLKELNPDIKIIAVEPYSSQVLTKGTAGPHKIQGIGANFVPDNFDKNIIDEIISVKNDDAINIARNLSSKEGILAGFSGGANVFAALEIASRPENKGKMIVTILPDCGERYLSSELYS